MRINYLIFSVFSALLFGLNSPVYANITETDAYNSDSNDKSGNGLRKFLSNLNRLELRLPRISRKKVSDKYSVEDLVSNLREVEKTRNKTNNPFKKIRCLIQESNIKRKINSLLKETEEGEKLEKLEEEFSMDYSPKALSEEGSIPPYVPVVIESYNDVSTTPEISIKSDVESQTVDKYLVSEGTDQSTSGEFEELPHSITSGIDIEKGSEDSVTQDLEQKVEVAEDDLEDYQTKYLGNESQQNMKDQDESTDFRESIDTEEKKKIHNMTRSFLSLFKRKKLTASEKLERLMLLKKNIESKISNSKSKISKRVLEMKLKRVNKKISKITEAAVDTIAESDEMDNE